MVGLPRPSDPLRASGSGPAPGAGPTPSTGPTPGTGPTGTGPAGTPGAGAATSPAWEAEARDLAGQVLRHLGAMHHGRSRDIQASTRGEAAVLFFLAQRSDDLPPPLSLIHI